MTENAICVDLGCVNIKIPEGTHICHIYNDPVERDETLLKFLSAGLEHGECNACFSENLSEARVAEYLVGRGHAYGDAVSSGAISCRSANDVYFKGGEFDPDRMLGMLADYYEKAIREGYPAARVIGEMSPEIDRIPGGSRLIEYESRVNILLRDHPVTAVCQYDAHAFDGATIMDVLSVHPMLILRGAVIMNPLFIPPEVFLA